MEEQEILRHISQLVKDVLGQDYKLYLYGSRAKGSSDIYSDFDFLVWGKKEVSRQQWVKLKEEVEGLETLYKIDLVDYHKLSGDFRAVIENHMKEVVNGRIRT